MSAPGLVIMVTRNKLPDTHKTEERNSNHCSILAWRILWTEEPGKVQLVGSQSQTRLSGSHTHTHTHTRVHTLRTSIWNALYRGHLWVLLSSKLDDLHTVLSPAGMKTGDQWPPGKKGNLELRRADPEPGEARKGNGRDSLEGPGHQGAMVWDCGLLSCSIHFREGDFFNHRLPM